MLQLRLSPVTAGVTAAVLVGLGLLLTARLRHRTAGRAVREIGVVLGLFALWMLVGRLAGSHPAGAYARGAAIWDTERALHLAVEPALQAPLLGHPLLAGAANYYYAYAHWLSVDVVLVWLWLRHGAHYVAARTALVVFTGACLLLHLASTAPPRLLPQTGLVDTAARLGQSVYADSPGVSDHLSAMPSIHVGWALLFAAVAWPVAGRLARSLLATHLVLTLYVVMATGNHFWLDGAAAAVLVAAALLAVRVQRRALAVPRRLRVTDCPS